MKAFEKVDKARLEEWRADPISRKVRDDLRATNARALEYLLATASESTDPRVRHAVAAYTVTLGLQELFEEPEEPEEEDDEL